MDTLNLTDKYYNLSREEVEKIRNTSSYPCFNSSIFEANLRLIHDERETEKKNGQSSVQAAPLVQVLSAHLLTDPSKLQVSVYGEICARVRSVDGEDVSHDLYRRNCDDPESIRPNGCLKLISSGFPSCPYDICMPLNNTRLVVDICVDGKRLFAEMPCSCVEDVTDFELVRLEYVHHEVCSLVLCYITMPLGIYGRVQFRFFCRKDEEQSRPNLNVQGKIIARYGNTYGGYDSEECILFEKNSNEFEPVDLDSWERMSLSRCWVCVPVYATLILDVDLFEFGTERRILKETIRIPGKSELSYCEEFIVDDILISVGVDYFSATPQGRLDEETDHETSGDEMSSKECSEEESDDAQMESPVLGVSSELTRTRALSPHRIVPFPSSAVQIFSVAVSRENIKALQVYGSIEVSSAAHTLNVFKREAREAFGLSEHKKTIPMLDAYGEYDDFDSLEMKVDLKDVENCLHIRGYVYWGARTFEFGTKWLNKQLCSVIQGQNSFATLHYSIFPEAIQANVQFWYIPNAGHMGVHPKVYGNIVAQYSNYDYTSRYNKDYYRVVLFERNEEDAVQLRPGAVIDLLRSKVVVPLNSSLVIEAALQIGVDKILSRTMDFKIGFGNYMTIDHCIEAHVKWEEVN